ncbi:caffeate O-methyltransferase-like protein 2 [Oryza glaberrima]|uniref:caffeate O-methyltransferase-like protein 2 n=1 Tax=Oryza glaberrima TaxID=4538 RepID=UPI00224C464D|nr:caffeate O-methyltransferase-like protein 2 [Oryza glaberrima]
MDKMTPAADGDDDETTCMRALELIFTFVVPMTLKATIKLGLLDALTGGGRALTADELVSAAQLPAEAASSVDRMLGLLASLDVVKCASTDTGGEAAVRRYTPAPVCRWFAGERSLAPLAMFLLDDDYLSTWNQLPAAVAGGGGQVAFEKARGMPMFEYMGTNRRLNTLFNQAMVQQSTVVIGKLLERFQGFDGVSVLVDVGGGTGATLEMITSRYKNITGVNFDLPHVIAQAPSLPGVKHIAGNMFESVPNGDAIFLKSMLHLHNDEECIKILKKCHQALTHNGKVIAVEIVLPAIPEPVATAQNPFRMDMIMLNNHWGGKERTEPEFAKLAVECGYTGVFRATYIFANYWALEFSK